MKADERPGVGRLTRALIVGTSRDCGLILAVKGGTIAEVSKALRELLHRHVLAGTIPGGVALLGARKDRKSVV